MAIDRMAVLVEGFRVGFARLQILTEGLRSTADAPAETNPTAFNDRLTILKAKLEEDTALVFSQSVIMDDYNQAMRVVAAKTDPFEMIGEYRFNTAANTRTYDLPSDYRQMMALYRGTKKMSREKMWEQEGINVNATAAPLAYAILDDSLYLRPVPDVAASMRMAYMKWPTNLTGTSSQITLNRNFLAAVESRVLARQFEQVGYFEHSDRQRAIYEQRMHDLMNQVEDSTGSDHSTTYGEVW